MPVTIQPTTLKYKDSNGQFISADCLKGDPVDVQVNGTSVVENGVANIPMASATAPGAIQLGGGFYYSSTTNKTSISTADTSQIKAGDSNIIFVSTNRMNEATFYGLAKAAGDSTQSASSNPVGTYTDEAKTAIKSMLGISESGGNVIDDTAGSGDTGKAWSANKLTAEFDLKAPKASPVFTGSVSMGRKSGTAVGTNSTALGLNAEASGTQSYAEGSGTTASGIYSHAEGGGTTASGVSSHAEGGSTEASGGWSHAEGGSTKAIYDYAHAEGSGTLASGSYSHAEGGGTKATAIGAHAEGSGSQATAANAHAEGGGTQAYGAQSHAEGGSTQAAGACSHAEGYMSAAGGFYSHAEGNSSYANGDSMHVSGSHNYIPALYASWTANTQYQVGDRVTYANGSHAYGYECITANNDSSFDSLKWEVLPFNGKFAEIVGNGKNNGSSNAYALDWNGNGYFAGDVYVGCNSDSTGGTKLHNVEVVRLA